MINELIDYGAKVNVYDRDLQITPLIYATIINNVDILNLLINSGANLNYQDINGYTALHYACSEENYNICEILLDGANINVNLYNIHSEIPIQLLLKNKNFDQNIFKKLLKMSNLNFQDLNGNTPFHIISLLSLWTEKQIKTILETKKLNAYIKNKDGKQPIDYIQKQYIDEYLKMIIDGYVYIIKHYDTTKLVDWEQKCIDENKLNDGDINDECMKLFLEKIKHFGCNTNNGKCIKIVYENVEFCTFVGSTLDILVGLMYLLKSYSYCCSTISDHFHENKELENYLKKLNWDIDYKYEFRNFEIIWVPNKIFFIDDFEKLFDNCRNNPDIRFIVIPLGIEMNIGNHANYLIYDGILNEIERFEPYGIDYPYQYDYNDVMLDNILKIKFELLGIKYIAPKDYLPKIGFQYFDARDTKTKIGDSEGFCGLWAIFYVDMRLKYPSISRTKLINNLIKSIKQSSYSFKTTIRNYSKNIVDLRDSLFIGTNVNINRWINEEINENEFNIIFNKLKNMKMQYITNIVSK